MNDYRFSGMMPGRKDPRTRNKGIMAKIRLQKRKQAEARNALTAFENTAKFRRLPLSEQEEYMNALSLAA